MPRMIDYASPCRPRLVGPAGANLWAVAVRQHQLVLLGDRSQRPRGHADVGALHIVCHYMGWSLSGPALWHH